MTEIEFHPEARRELLDAAEYYESQAPKLGQDFVSLVERTFTLLLEFPQMGRPFGRRARRTVVPRFPYALIYAILSDRIYIVAVMHLHRRPGYWKSRS